MRTLICFAFFLSAFIPGRAQLNTSLLAQLDYEQELNDIWGWKAPDGVEYALVGTTTGVSIVSLADPADPREVAFVPGEFSVWRDLKTFGNYAYVTTDQPRTKEGVLIIDLSELPRRVRSVNWRPVFSLRDTIHTCHNLYIDERGVAYLAGCNANAGGVIFLDVAANPEAPPIIGAGPRVYAHDVYVQDNRMFTSDLYLGQLGIYDVTDVQEVVPLASQATPFRFTHNAWASPDGRYVFTTDERANAPTAAFDISDLNDIIPLDQYRPPASVGQGVIPHNVHVYKNWLVISHYTDGVRIVDATRPQNLVEVGFYPTSDAGPGGFSGAWGAYPFLPSGRLLVSDIENGLFVLDADHQRAAYLEGRVTSAAGGAAIRDVEVTIETSVRATSDSRGEYRTGLAGGGSFDVVFRHPEYQEKRVAVSLTAGEVRTLDVVLTPKDRLSVSGRTVSLLGNTAVPGARVLVRNADYRYETRADANGRFQFNDIVAGTYDVFAGAWGYRHRRLAGLVLDNSSSFTITLEEGYQDDFLFDLGWTSDGQAASGFWQRGIPEGSRSGNTQLSPAAGIPGDFGDDCYATGNAGGGPGADDVDDGFVRLTSPPFDLTGYRAPVLSYYLWFFSGFGGNPPNDSLSVYLTNGADTVVLEHVTQPRSAWRPRSVFRPAGLIELTGAMRLIVVTADHPGSGNIVEAAFDAFLVEEETTTSTGDPVMAGASMHAFPNPWREMLTVEYKLPEGMAGRGAMLTLFDHLGRALYRYPLGQTEGMIAVGEVLPAGVYHLVLTAEGRRVGMRSVVKMKE